MAKSPTIQSDQKPKSGGAGLRFPDPKLPTYPKSVVAPKSPVSVEHRVFDGRDISANLAMNSTHAWLVRIENLARKNTDVRRLLTEYENLKQDQTTKQ